MKWLSVLAATVGIFFCTLNALGIETFCVTSGCAITADFSIFGISLYFFGAAAFGGFIAVRLLGTRKWTLMYALAFLVADIIFLAAMSFMAPCLSCLIVAALIFLLAVLSLLDVRKDSLPTTTKAIHYSLVAWMIFASPNTLNVASELLGPSPIHGTAKAPIKIFFSPTCPACKDMVVEVMESSPDNVALYPVGKDQVDMEKICALSCKYEESENIQLALDACWSGDCQKEMSILEQTALSIKLWRNKIHLAKMGKDSVPVMITQMIPETRQEKTKTNSGFDKFNNWNGSSQDKKGACSFTTTEEDDCDS